MKKQILSVILALLIVVSMLFVSCGKDEKDEPKSDAAESKEISAEVSKEVSAEESKEIVIDDETLAASVEKSSVDGVDIITVKVSFKEERTDSAIGVEYVYDDKVLELSDIEWLLDDAVISDATVGELAVIAFDEPKKIDSDFIEFTFKVKDGAEADETVLKVITILQEEKDKLEYEADVNINIG